MRAEKQHTHNKTTLPLLWILQGSILFLVAFIWLGPCFLHEPVTWISLRNCAFQIPQSVSVELVQPSRLGEDLERAKQIDAQQMIAKRLSNLKVLPSTSIDTRYPNRFQPDFAQTQTGLAHWLRILPFEEDRQEQSYLVIPRYGMVAPVQQASASDEERLIAGQSADYQQYLAQGVLQHPGTVPPFVGTGNRVLAGHTSYFTKKPGNYKTIFQPLPMMMTGDEMWVYVASGTQWTRYVYMTQASFLTTPNDRGILVSSPTQHQLTLYGCYPFGSLAERWIVQGNLIDVDSQ